MAARAHRGLLWRPRRSARRARRDSHGGARRRRNHILHHYRRPLLRSFLKDTGNQLVLGTFIGTFLYSLLVLQTVRSTDESPFVPHLAVTLGLVLAVLSVCMLVYFIQHIVNSIQASRIIGMAGNDLLTAVDRLFPSQIGDSAAAGDADAGTVPGRSASIRADRSGYVQAIDGEALLSFAIERAGVTELSA